MTTFIPFEKYFKLELRTKELEKEIRKLKKIINKPVETTNERPNEEEIKSIQKFLLNIASEADASILESYLSKFNKGVFS